MEQSNTSSILQKKIHEARKKIQAVGSYVDFHAFVKKHKGRRSGLSNSNITNLLNKIQSDAEKNKDLDNHKRKVEEFSKLVDRYALSVKSNETNFHGTVWELYFFYGLYKEDTGIGRAALEIDTEGIVHIHNIGNSVSTDYEGSFNLIDDNVLFLDLQGRPNGRKIHMKVMTRSSPHELALGSYTSYEKQQIFSGTIIFRKYEGNVQDIERGVFAYSKNYDKFSKIPIDVRRFLSLKKENLIKVPNYVNNLKDLKRFHEDYRSNKRRLFFNVDKPIVFISAPMHSIDKDKYAKNNSIINRIIKELKEDFKSEDIGIDIQYPGEEQIEGRRNTRLAKNRIIDNFENLKRVKFFVLIFDSSNPSISLVELGMALVYCKHVMVFYTDKETFPSMLPHLGTSRRLRYFVCHYIDSLEQNEDFIFETIDLEIRDNLGRRDEEEKRE